MGEYAGEGVRSQDQFAARFIKQMFRSRMVRFAASGRRRPHPAGIFSLNREIKS
jgi:hypothetical protein